MAEPEAADARRPSWLGRVLIAVGVTGAALAALCCIAPLLIAGLVTAIGLGFLLKASVLLGLLVVFMGVALFGYYLLRRRRQA
jgi:hypothetical protein